jgi:adenosylcobinamide kinase/adenosylcobinamide-phosphate guanylyltransferase
MGEQIYQSELIIGGQKSGKSKRAEQLARFWLDTSQTHRAALIATAQVFDGEMKSRVDHHRELRAKTIPEVIVIEEPVHIGEMIVRHSSPDTLIILDCLTVWLTNLLMPHPDLASSEQVDADKEVGLFLQALGHAKGPVMLVSNEIGLGVIPMGRETRRFVDELGRLNQRVAEVSAAVTLMVAGIPIKAKRPS